MSEAKPKPAPKRSRSPEQIRAIVNAASAYVEDPENKAKATAFCKLVPGAPYVDKEGKTHKTFALPAGRPIRDAIVSAKRWVETDGVNARWPDAHKAA